MYHLFQTSLHLLEDTEQAAKAEIVGDETGLLVKATVLRSEIRFCFLKKVTHTRKLLIMALYIMRCYDLQYVIVRA